jgi:drug/metabolite transporter superfamily protein YnfA
VGGDVAVSAEFLSGATMVASAVIALFFLRYWRETRDRLFLMFAGGFFTFALSRLLLAFLDEKDEGRVLVYMLRLVAFALILAAIVEKNRSHRQASRGASAH